MSFTILAVGACFVIAASAASGWRAPRVFAPLLAMGRLSYEIYLTHMFVVMWLAALFVRSGKAMRGVPLLFVAVIVCATALGWVISKMYTEPMNLWIRRRAGDGPRELGVAVESS